MMKPFIHLHTHSHYSLLESLSKVKALVTVAKKDTMGSLAITDYSNMYGAMEFYKTCSENEIKPILGVDLFVKTNTPTEEFTRKRITLLSKNEIGYKNLISLVTSANTHNIEPRPHVTKKELQKHSDGIICLSGFFGSELWDAVLNYKDKYRYLSVIKNYQEIFGKENYFIEIMHHPNIPGAKELKEKLINISKEIDVELVATHDSHYITPDDAKAHTVLLDIQKTINSDENTHLKNDLADFSFISQKQANDYFKDVPEALENTQKIADLCNVTLELGTWTFPKFEIPDDTTYDNKLRSDVFAGIKKRGLTETKEILQRIDYELEIIRFKKFSPYFMIVGDLLRFARENNIFTTIRGSVAGSLVTYLIGITNVNPLDYKLPFERFLNPERPSAPDIDMDFADNKRDMMLNYAREKYGKEKVAQIGTFGTMMAKGSVRDIARALGHPYRIGDKIASYIPMGSQGFPMTIDRALEMVPELKAIYDEDSTGNEILSLAKKVEGCARHISVHAAGVVISPTKLTDFVPTQLDPKGGKLITQYDMHGVEDAGLIKFDFLGIRNLAILADAVHLVEKYYNKKINIENIPVDDEKTFNLLARGFTMGLFQLNGAGMTAHLRNLKPTTIHDINAMVALYRPGPMESIPEYIKRKHNAKLIEFLDPRLEHILDQSYGVITYQDDVMMIAIELAGYSWLEADKLRKAMGKKIPAEMNKQKEQLFSGFKKNGLTDKKIKELWARIEPFAAYGFNKAHAASYGRVAYQTAFMKANYPTEFMTAILTAESGDIEKIAEIITECRRLDITVLPPDINESFGEFTINKSRQENKSDEIRFGLNTIKNLGETIATAIYKEREQNGKYISFIDFLSRVNHKDLNKKSIEALAKVGALDKLIERNTVCKNIETIITYIKNINQSRANTASSLFADMDLDKPKIKLHKVDAASQKQKLMWEKELLGVYVTGHPTAPFKYYLENTTTSLAEISEKHTEKKITIGGVISKIKKIRTKRGETMFFVTIEDEHNTIEVLVFPRLLKETETKWKEEELVTISGTVSTKNGELKILADAITPLTSSDTKQFERIRKTQEKFQCSHIVIHIPDTVTKKTLHELSLYLQSIPQGRHQVFIKLKDKKIQTSFTITPPKDFDEKCLQFIQNCSIEKGI